MHIPGHMLQGPVSPVTAVLAAGVVALAVWKGIKAKEKPKALRFAAITALIFALQMLNFPVQNGTSGHFLGTTFAVLLLGPPFGILAMALVLTVQCLVFADGGLEVLGANIFNMAIVGAAPALLYYFLKGKGLWEKSPLLKQIGVFIASWLSVVLAALACASELAIAGVVAFEKVFPAMGGIHALIGLGEGLLSMALVLLLSAKRIQQNERLSLWVPTLGAVVAGLLLSPLASSFPDGLEWVAGQLDFLHEGAPLFVAPLADYAFPGINSEILATGLAGLVGVVLTFALVAGLGYLLNITKKSETFNNKEN